MQMNNILWNSIIFLALIQGHSRCSQRSSQGHTKGHQVQDRVSFCVLFHHSKYLLVIPPSLSEWSRICGHYSTSGSFSFLNSFLDLILFCAIVHISITVLFAVDELVVNLNFKVSSHIGCGSTAHRDVITETFFQLRL